MSSQLSPNCQRKDVPVLIPSNVRTRYIKGTVRTKVARDLRDTAEVASDRIAFFTKVELAEGVEGGRGGGVARWKGRSGVGQVGAVVPDRHLEDARGCCEQSAVRSGLL